MRKQRDFGTFYFNVKKWSKPFQIHIMPRITEPLNWIGFAIINS